MGPGVGASVQGECNRQVAIVGRRTIKNGMGHEHDIGHEGWGVKEWKRTADTASVMMRCNFSPSKGISESEGQRHVEH